MKLKYAAIVLLAGSSSASGTASGEMRTFEQQVSVAQDKNTRASGHAESKSNTELPECSTLGIARSTEGCTTYCTDKNLGSGGLNIGIIGDDTVGTCSCTLDGTTTNVCIRSPPGPNTEGKPCADFGVTDAKTCRDYCLPASTLTKIGDYEIVSCTCGSIGDVTTEPFSCSSTTSSSSALSLLLPGVVVTVTTYLITMVI